MLGVGARGPGPHTISSRVRLNKKTASATRVDRSLLSKNMRLESPLWIVEGGMLEHCITQNELTQFLRPSTIFVPLRAYAQRNHRPLSHPPQARQRRHRRRLRS